MAIYQCVKCGKGVETNEQHECKPYDYKEKFKDIPLETKRKDVENHPFIDKDRIKEATDKDIEVLYYELFSNMDLAMREVLGESMFDDEF